MGHFAVSIPLGLPWLFRLMLLLSACADARFQSRSGFPGQLADEVPEPAGDVLQVSIPLGLPGPFCLPLHDLPSQQLIGFNPARASLAVSPLRCRPICWGTQSVSIPLGLPWLFRRMGSVVVHVGQHVVSIPLGLPGPFSQPDQRDAKICAMFQSRTGFPGLLAARDAYVPAAQSPFQSRSGFPGLLAGCHLGQRTESHCVSIPLGPPGPFSPLQAQITQIAQAQAFQSRSGFPGWFASARWNTLGLTPSSFNPARASLAASPSMSSASRSFLTCFNPARASQAVSPPTMPTSPPMPMGFNPARASLAASPPRYSSMITFPSRFNPARASQAGSPRTHNIELIELQRFQSGSGFPAISCINRACPIPIAVLYPIPQ